MPPATSANIQNYASLIAKSRLLTADEVQTALNRWQALGKGDSDDVDAFRKFVVRSGLLTDYQAALVQRGHSEGFFLDSYKILDLIGKGRMAGVYRGMHSSGQIVAIKVLPPSKAKDPTTLSRFQREGRMLTKLDHPNVVRAFQIGEFAGKYYFVMEQIEGETLEEVLQRRNRLPPMEAIRIAYQVLMGLQHVHEKGLIHRDIKPANIMLTPVPLPGEPDTTVRSTAKILDIGLGRTVFDENAKSDEEESQLTSTGTLLGTPDYLAPEQAHNAHAADIRADIYSVGCVLYHMLAGQVPFPETNVVRQVLRHATEQAKPIAEYGQPMPDGLEQVLNWMMAKTPAQRYPTPERAAMALQIFLMNDPQAAMAPVPSPVNPAFVQWLQASGNAEPAPARPAATTQAYASMPAPPAITPPPPPLPAPVVENIPVGKLESVRGKGEKPREQPKAKEAPKPKPPAPPAAQPVSAPPIQTALAVDDFDVELVTVPNPTFTPPAPAKVKEEARGLFELNRRDWLMLGIGGGGVLFAILAGYGIAQIARRGSPPSPTEEEKKEPPKGE